MQRRTFIRNTSFFLGALSLTGNKAFAGFMDDYKIRMLTKDIGIFSERGGTILFYLSKEGMVVIDAQFPDTAAHLVDELKKRGERYHLLINTHHHADHTSGNIVFKDLVPHLRAHENSKANQLRVAEVENTLDKQFLPDQLFQSTWCEKIGKEEICMHYFGPGHTNGDAIIHFKKANIVHLGDLVFNRRHPFIDKPAGASIAGWIHVLDTCTGTFNKKTRYVCGHAAPGYEVVAGEDDLIAFRDYLRNLLLFTGGLISAGKTRGEILQSTEIPGSPEWKDGKIERPLDAAYTELTAKMD